MADETMGPEAKPLLGYWGSPMRPKRADPGIERQFEREAVALPIYAAMVAHEYRGEDGSVSNARDSFVLADFWITERDRQRKNGRAPEPDPNARATGLDASGSIELGSKSDPSRAVTVTAELLGHFRALQAAARRVVDAQRNGGFGRGTAIERLSDALDLLPIDSCDEMQG